MGGAIAPLLNTFSWRGTSTGTTLLLMYHETTCFYHRVTPVVQRLIGECGSCCGPFVFRIVIGCDECYGLQPEACAGAEIIGGAVVSFRFAAFHSGGSSVAVM
jgi:hypothetical protein